jgi:hypothetical protein
MGAGRNPARRGRARAAVSNQTVESRCAWNLDVLDYAFTAEQMIIDTSDGNRPRS